MKLVSYEEDSSIKIGALSGDLVIPFSNDPNIQNDMLSFLESGEAVIDLAKNVIEKNQNTI